MTIKPGRSRAARVVTAHAYSYVVPVSANIAREAVLSEFTSNPDLSCLQGGPAPEDQL